MLCSTGEGWRGKKMEKKKSYWIWNQGDYEIFHSNRVNSRRQEYGADYPVFWRLFDVDRNVIFYAKVKTTQPGILVLHVKGMGNILVDGERYPSGKEVEVKAGEHTLQICVTNLAGLPAAYVESNVCATDGSWYTLDENRKEIPVGYAAQYDAPEKNPEEFPFCYEKKQPVERKKVEDGILFDFGKELFGYLDICGVATTDKLHVSYGESLEEALDIEYAILREDVTGQESYRLRQRAFRYIFIQGSEQVEVEADYEYLPLDFKGSFHCSDEDVNKIWDMCAYTLHLTSREVHLEAIKRDGWLWGGDAYQIYKFNNYLFYDPDLIKRSTIALRGKEPFVEHINTITDYSFYWVIGLYEYYMAYGDLDFIKFIYPRAVTLMEFSKKRVNKDGFICGVGADWIFIDWSDIDKDGAACAEQLLFIEANKTMAKLAALLGEDGTDYEETVKQLTEKVNAFFWSKEKGAFIDCYESGRNHVTRHANIFAIMYGIATKEQTESIQKNVLFNDEITQITTPYFEGYELDVMGMLGQFDFIEHKIRSYWKGMMDLGATTVWEEYDPTLSGADHYQMYGNKYGKSLCHAWGASPIYLLGRYFLGVTPTAPGFETFEVKPHLGSFDYIEGTVPMKNGEVKVYLSKEKLCVTATKEGGTLLFEGKRYTLETDKELVLVLQK